VSDTDDAADDAADDAPHELSEDQRDYLDSLSKLDSDLDMLTQAVGALGNAGHEQGRVACISDYIVKLTTYIEHLNNVFVLRHNLFGAEQ